MIIKRGSYILSLNLSNNTINNNVLYEVLNDINITDPKNWDNELFNTPKFKSLIRLLDLDGCDPTILEGKIYISEGL